MAITLKNVDVLKKIMDVKRAVWALTETLITE